MDIASTQPTFAVAVFFWLVFILNFSAISSRDSGKPTKVFSQFSSAKKNVFVIEEWIKESIDGSGLLSNLIFDRRPHKHVLLK